MERKGQLIERLIEEKQKLYSKGLNVSDHDLAIQYLQTGFYPSYIDLYKYDILQAAIEDYKTLESDYLD